MEPVWSKFDKELAAIYSNYLQIKSTAATPGQYIHSALKTSRVELFLTMQYKGNLSGLEAIGFKTVSVEREGVANGVVKYTQLADLSAHPDVTKLVYGSEMHPTLDTSTLEMLVRGATAGTNCLWSVVPATGVFTGMTGAGIIIGIIDTGIDYRHESFQEENSTNTRIKRIWDMGLTPIAGENSPAAALLSSPGTYGVEYTDTQINGALATPSTFNVRTKDCNGHGTHVAGIAAGNGKQSNLTTDPRFVFTGVAPKATLVIVKLLHLRTDPAFSFLKRFKDAISYILNIAGTDQVVINCSFGHDTGPHDGLLEDGNDGQETFLETTFETATGKICVFAAGNSAMRGHHAVITMPAAGTIEVPFELFDDRTTKRDFYRCVTQQVTSRLGLDFWYKDGIAGVTGAIKVPAGTDFHPTTGVTLGAAVFSHTFNTNKNLTINHSPNTTPRSGTPLTRNNIFMEVQPFGVNHRVGTYVVKLAAPAGTEIHVWCAQSKGYGFRMGAAVPAGVVVTDTATVGSPAHTPSVVTVGAYDDTNDHLACFSSQGPLADFSGLGVLVHKPDLSAPGVRIMSAKSFQLVAEPAATVAFTARGVTGGYHQKSGTSMAAPHITGLVALMLQKKNNQTLTEIKFNLETTVRTGPQIFPSTIACSATTPSVLPATAVASNDEAGMGKVDANHAVSNIIP
jgi:subtilisin family serine protease